jgi:hypothetical protein
MLKKTSAGGSHPHWRLFFLSAINPWDKPWAEKLVVRISG